MWPFNTLIEGFITSSYTNKGQHSQNVHWSTLRLIQTETKVNQQTLKKASIRHKKHVKRVKHQPLTEEYECHSKYR